MSSAASLGSKQQLDLGGETNAPTRCGSECALTSVNAMQGTVQSLLKGDNCHLPLGGTVSSGKEETVTAGCEAEGWRASLPITELAAGSTPVWDPHFPTDWNKFSAF